jgi:hypothetical protein
MPQARFLDVVQTTLTEKITYATLCADFVFVCEPGSLLVVGVVPSQPVSLGVVVNCNSQLVITLAETPCEPVQVTVLISGVRRGYLARFPRFTQQQMDHNNAFWDRARS